MRLRANSCSVRSCSLSFPSGDESGGGALVRYRILAEFNLIVIPRSRSRSMPSRNWARPVAALATTTVVVPSAEEEEGGAAELSTVNGALFFLLSSSNTRLPVASSSLSARVLFPWSMCATMQKLRMREGGSSA